MIDRRRKRFAFSLLEIIVVISILALGLGIAGIQIAKSIQQSRFKETKSLILDKVSQAMRISRLTSSRVDVSFVKEDGRVFIYLNGENIPNTKLKNKIQLKDELLGIGAVEYSNKIGDFTTESDPVKISISHEGQQNFGNLALKLHASGSIAYDIPLNEIFETDEESTFTYELFPKDFVETEEKMPVSSS